MKPVMTAIVLLLALPTACGGAVETDASKNAEVVGVVGEGDGDDVPASDGGAVEEESTTGQSGGVRDPDEADEPGDVDGSDDGVGEQDDADDGDAQVDEDEDDGGGGGGERASAVALTRAQIDALRAAEPETNTATATTGGNLPALDPADLFLKVSDLGAACDEAYTELSCGGHWSLSIALPPEYQAVGVYDLGDWKISQYSMMSETTEAYSTPEDCGWGGGSIGGGTIEVLAIDESEVRFRVDMQSAFLEENPNGEYTAIRCP